MAVKKGSSFAERAIAGLEQIVTGGLNTLGFEGADIAKAIQEDNEYTGRTKDSITYSVAQVPRNPAVKYSMPHAGNPNLEKVGPAAESGDVIHGVQERFLLHIGTAVPYAKWIEFGSAPHTTPEDMEGFLLRITEWGLDHGMDERDIENLIDTIRMQGVDEHPFLLPTMERLREEMAAIMKRELNKLRGAIRKYVTEISVDKGQIKLVRREG